MAIEKMRLVKISSTLGELDKVLSDICMAGVFQPEQAQSFYSLSMGLTQFPEENTASQKMSDIESFAGSAGLRLKIKHRSEYHEFMDSIPSDDKFFSGISEKLREYSKEKAALDEQKKMCLEAIEKYSHFKELDVDFGAINECRYVKPRFGHMPKSSYERLYALGIVRGNAQGTSSKAHAEREGDRHYAEYFAKHPYITFFPCSFEGDECWGVYFAPRDKEDEVDGLFASLLFEKMIGNEVTGRVDEILEGLQSNIDIVNDSIEKLDEKLKSLCRDEEEHINQYYTKLAFENARSELKSYAYHNDEYFFLVGWIPKKQEVSFVARLEELDKNISIECSDPDMSMKVSPPVRITGFAKIFGFIVNPYRFYVNMYGTPSYYDLDITAFVAFTYTVLFGMMFGDLGQGLVLSLVGYGMWKFKKMELGKILVPCGLSSMVFGFLFGSVFGYEEMLNPVYHALGWSGKPISVMDSVNLVLLAAIAIGVVLVIFAILLNIAGCIKRHCYGEAFFSQNGVVGLILYVCGANLASAFMKGPAPIPTSLCMPAIIICAILLVFKEIPIEALDRHHIEKPDSIMDFILQNVFELVEYILSYMSNTVSFLRVGAFVLVHAGMMMVVFSLAGQNPNIFVVILGNILVIALEGLLTGIQALRLEYYEMFSRFYIGDGRPFKPAKARRKHTN